MPTPWLEEVVQKLRSRPRQSLAPKRVWDADLEREIIQATQEQLLGDAAAKKEDVLALKAGLLLWNDSLDASHRFSQQVHSTLGSYWHGIMHRMEGDYSNAKYWFRMTGEHPVFEPLQRKWSNHKDEFRSGPASQSAPSGLNGGHGGTVAERLARLAANDRWDPFAFVDLVAQTVAIGTKAETEWVERVQRWEMELLLNYTYQRCCGGTLIETG